MPKGIFDQTPVRIAPSVHSAPRVLEHRVDCGIENWALSVAPDRVCAGVNLKFALSELLGNGELIRTKFPVPKVPRTVRIELAREPVCKTVF